MILAATLRWWTFPTAITGNMRSLPSVSGSAYVPLWAGWVGGLEGSP